MKQLGRKIGYLVLVLFFGACFMWFQSYAILAILLVLLLMPLISVALCRIAFRGIEFSIGITDATLEKNLSFPVHLHIKNRSFVPILECGVCLSWSNGYSKEKDRNIIHIPVYGHGEQKATIPVESEHCGVARFEVEEVRIQDYLCLYQLVRPVHVVREVPIFPERREGVTVDTNAYTSGNDDAEESHTKGSDFSEVSNIREYIPGDNLKDIHWKLSVKKEQLMVKEHVTMSARQIAILFELHNDENQCIDAILDMVYSASCYLVEQRRAFTLYWWSVEVGCIKERAILTMADLEQTFGEILYEKAYPEEDKAWTEFMLTDTRLEHIMWIKDGSPLKNCEVER